MDAAAADFCEFQMECMYKQVQKISTGRTLEKCNKRGIFIEFVKPLHPVLECGARDSGCLGKFPLTDFLLAAQEIDNVSGHILSGPFDFGVCILREIVVLRIHSPVCV